MNTKYLFLLSMAMLLALVSPELRAQQSSRGRDFYLSFLPNYHDSQTARDDSLYLYVVAQQITNGSIELRSRSGKTSTINFRITNPQNIFSVSLPWLDYELYGYNQAQLKEPFTGDFDLERASRQLVAVHADQDVAVYALSKANMSSDASLILPTSCLGTDYCVLSYKSDGSMSGKALSASYTPSEFSVVATQDNTDIRINTSCATTSGSRTLNVRLQRGESYLVQAQFSTTVFNNDLSGSSVNATKPVAVFAGHQRSLITVGSDIVSRDCLYEQMLPTSVWGTRYVLTPLAQPLNGTTIGNDLFRVLASQDNTVLRLNDKVIATLSKNSFYEGNLTQAGLLSADKPVQVALYKKSAWNGRGFDSDGDPFMMIIPPRRQYLSEYRFTNVQVDAVYRQQYVTVIVSTADVSSLRLDGSAIKASFSTIGNSCYSYASLSMKDGAHSLKCASPFGLYVYGFGAADSYGYVGGMAFYPDSPDIHVDAGDDQLICPGKSATLTASHAAKSIRWTPATGLDCDTCSTTQAHPTKTTTYIVSAVDSSGCSSTDTVVVRVRPMEILYSLSAADEQDSMRAPIGDSFELCFFAKSEAWEELSTTSITTTIKVDPHILQFVDSLRREDALPSSWHLEVVRAQSDVYKGILVVHAWGDSAITTSGELFAAVYRSLLDSSYTVNPSLSVSTITRNTACSASKSDASVIQLAGCAINLRHILVSPYTTTLYAPSPNPVSQPTIALRYSLAFEGAVTLRLYSVSGQVIQQLQSGWQTAGEHSVVVDLAALSSDVYYAVLQNNDVVLRQTIVVQR